MSNVYLSICYTKNHLGAAFYDDQQEAVYILYDVAEDFDYTSLTNLIKEVRPTYVIASRAQDASFLLKLRTLCNYNIPDQTFANEESEEEPPENDPVDVTTGYAEYMESQQVPVFNGTLNQPASQINSSKVNNAVDAKSMVVSSTRNITETSNCPAQEADEDEVEEAENNEEDEKIYAVLTLLPFLSFDEEEAKKQINLLFADYDQRANLTANFRLDFRAKNTVRALGALLRFLDQQRIGVEFDDLSVKTPIKAIRTVTIDDIVEIDQATYKALQVFESEYNPMAFRKKNIAGAQFRDGVSLFSLCNLCRCMPGKQMIRRWFERPTTNRQTLIQRQNAISFFYQDCNLDVGRFLRTKVKDVSNIKPILRRLKGGSAAVNDYLNIYQTCISLIEISRFIYEREINLAILKGKMNYNEDLLRLAGLINEVMDFEESIAENRFVCKTGLDEELDILKTKYAELPGYLTNVAREEAELYHLEACSVGYVPIIGYLLVLSEDVTLEGQAAKRLKMVYNADGDNYYKTARMDELDREIGDVKMQIIDCETTAMIRLQTLILKRSKSLFQAVDVVSILDCLTSLAAVARELNWHRPQLVEEAIIDIRSARHPLSELTCAFNFVPNPIKSGGEFTKVKLISGPNASGKSVYLKTIGIVAYLAHIGSFVPAENAIIGPINRIVTRMYTIDSVMDGMSSFANDLKQMSGAIRRADQFSLVIMDEFGKGTMTEVGLSLLASSLNYWLEKGKERCPHIFAASHFHSLKELLIPVDFISYHTLDVIRNGDELEFQYKLIEGIIDNSFASYIALKNGIPREIVNRANQVYDHLKEGKTLVDVPQQSRKEDEETYWLAERMESLMDAFMEWDLTTDPLGFLKLAKMTLTNEDDLENEQNDSAQMDDCVMITEEVTRRTTTIVVDGTTSNKTNDKVLEVITLE